MATRLRAGAARVEITPPIGADLTGYIARQNPSDSVRDPLYVRALVLEDGDSQAALVSCDLLGFDRDLVDEIRDRIAVATGIAAPNVMLACTHTHGGPATILLIDCGEINSTYVESLLPRITQAVSMAQANLEPATLALGSGSATAGVFNRRTPGDVIDPEVGVLRINARSAANGGAENNSEGKTIAVVVNYTCHPTSLNATNRQITADYPGLVSSRLEEATGGVALFLMGAIGDVGPVARGEESLTTVGNAVVEAAIAALPALAASQTEVVELAGEMLALPLLPLPSRADWLTWRTGYEEAALTLEGNDKLMEAKSQWAMVHWTERMFEKMQDGTLAPTVNVEIQLLRIGDLVIVGVPAEYFVELGLQIKAGIQAQGVRQVMIAGFTNGDIGYVPARRAYPKGGYEVADAYRYYGYPTAVAPEGGEMIVASAVALAERVAE